MYFLGGKVPVGSFIGVRIAILFWIGHAAEWAAAYFVANKPVNICRLLAIVTNRVTDAITEPFIQGARFISPAKIRSKFSESMSDFMTCYIKRSERSIASASVAVSHFRTVPE